LIGGKTLTRFCTDTNGLWADTAIDFEIFIGEPLAELSHLGNTPIQELLTASAL
jgi:hypothetical protein